MSSLTATLLACLRTIAAASGPTRLVMKSRNGGVSGAAANILRARGLVTITGVTRTGRLATITDAGRAALAAHPNC